MLTGAAGRGQAEEPGPGRRSRSPLTSFRPRGQLPPPCSGEATALPAGEGTPRLSSGSASTCGPGGRREPGEAG